MSYQEVSEEVHVNKVSETSTTLATTTSETITMATAANSAVTLETEVVTTTTTTVTTSATVNKVTVTNSQDQEATIDVSANGGEDQAEDKPVTTNTISEELVTDNNGDSQSGHNIKKIDFKSLLPRIKAKILQPGEELPADQQGIKTMMVINKDGTKTVLTVVGKTENNDTAGQSSTMLTNSNSEQKECKWNC